MRQADEQATKCRLFKSKPYAGEAGGKCVSIDCVNPHYYSGVDYNTQEEKDDAHRILNALNATAQLPDTILQNLAQHPGRLYAILETPEPPKGADETFAN